MTAPDPDDLLPTPEGWSRAAPWLPPFLRRGRCYQGPTGSLLRMNHAGIIDVVQQGGRPHAGVAADPALGGKPRRY